MNNFDITPIKDENEKLYKKIVDKVMSLIYSGKLKYGDKLYREDEFIERLNVSRASLREALRVLEFMNIITVKPRKGITISNPKDKIDFPPLRYLLEFENINNFDLLNLRKAIELVSIEIIINNPNNDNKEKIKTIMEDYKKCKDNKILFELDAMLHNSIVEMSNNKLALKLFNTFYSLLHKQGINYSNLIYNDDNTSYEKKLHISIMNSIINDDLEDAIKYLKIHFSDIEKRIKNNK